MPVSIGDATVAMNAVLKKYQSYLDSSVAAAVQNMAVGKIFRILSQAEYTPYFNSVFKNFFAAINVVALGGTRKMIDLANTATDAAPAIACPAFTAPAVKVTDRVIYVNADANITIGTLYHEFVHFLEHGNFYPEYYSLGGNNPKILEGVTEYLTREVDSSIKAERQNQGKYGSFLAETLNRTWGNPAETLAKMVRVAFQGACRACPREATVLVMQPSACSAHTLLSLTLDAQLAVRLVSPRAFLLRTRRSPDGKGFYVGSSSFSAPLKRAQNLHLLTTYYT